MKIALVAQPDDPVLPPMQNSIGIIIYEIAMRLSHHHKVSIFMRGGRARLAKERHAELDIYKVPRGPDAVLKRIIHLLGRSRDPRKAAFAAVWYDFFYALATALVLRRGAFDLVHVVNISQFLPVIRALNPKIKIVLHMECEWLTQLDEKWMMKRIAAADSIIGCSEYITQLIRQRFPDSAPKCSTVFNGVDTDVFKPAQSLAELSAQPKTVDFLFIGRLSPEKGIHTLFKAFSIVQQERPDCTLKLIGPQRLAPVEFIVPLSNDPLVHKLNDYYTSVYLDNCFDGITSQCREMIFLQRSVPYAELVNEYRQSKAFVFPSEWSEPFGMPVVEAMACGIPVIATRSGGICELVEPNVTGLLVDRGDAAQLAEAMLSLLGNEERQYEMGSRGVKRVAQYFTWDKVAEDFKERYEASVTRKCL